MNIWNMTIAVLIMIATSSTVAISVTSDYD